MKNACEITRTSKKTAVTENNDRKVVNYMKKENINEDFVETKLIEWLEKNGWKISNKSKKKNEGGIDIRGYRHGRTIWIEAKGDRKRYHQAVHDSFTSAIGQILYIMKEDQKYRYYGIAIPASWENVWKRKIKEMEYAWKQLRLRIYLVHKNGKIEMKNYRKMLK